MYNLTDIHDIRQRKGYVRQPSYGKGLNELHSEINGMGLTHPYRLIDTHINKLMTNSLYSKGGVGPPARFTNQEYIYRLSGVKKVAEYSSGWFSTSPRKEDQDPVIFRHWANAFNKRGSWLPLSDYAQGDYASPRDFTFWTSFELRPESLLDSACQIGFTGDRLDEYSVILRCRVDRLEAVARIPTVLDGFDSEIFHPVRTSDNPPSGTTIKLTIPGPLKAGSREYALGPIAVSEVEMLPITVDSSSGTYIDSDDPALWDSLARYY